MITAGNFTYFCPHCNTLLKKNANMCTLGRVLGRPARMFISFVGKPPSSVTCPSCDMAIDAKGIMEGKYDPAGRIVAIDWIFFLLWIGIIVVLMLAFKFGFWVSLGIATYAIVAVSVIVCILWMILKNKTA